MRRLVVGGLAVAILLVAAVFAAQGAWPWPRWGDPRPAPTLVEIDQATSPARIASDTLRPGEALGDLFGRHGIGSIDVAAVLELLGLDPRRVRAGAVFRFGHHDSTPHARDVTVRTRPEEETRVTKSTDGWEAERRPIRWTTESSRLEGRIETSLFDALTEALATAPVSTDNRVRLAWDLADVFAWTVDFTRDLERGDRFVVLFERQVSELGETRLGAILASDLEVANRRVTAFRFEETRDGRAQYFDEEGTSLRRAFLRSPVEFRRIASGFSRARLHPILGIRRRHEGIDYSASGGTPVLAAGDGSVLTAGWSGGYGRMIELRHRNGVTTRYAHLRGFARGIQRGSTVRQGEVIGFVGATGLATAAHLHYEFRQGGVARDPNRVELGSGSPVSAAERPAFVIERDRLRALLWPTERTADAIVASDR